MITVVLVKNVFEPDNGREIYKLPYIDGKSVEDYVRPLADDYSGYNTSINDNKVYYEPAFCTLYKKQIKRSLLKKKRLKSRYIPVKVIANRKLKDGDIIIVSPIVGKGGFLGLIATLALGFVAFGVGGLVATGAWGVMGTTFGSMLIGNLVAGAIMMLGGSLIQRCFGTSKIGSKDVSADPTYSWDGVTSTTGQGAFVPITYGTVLSGGQIISQFVETSGNKQYLHRLYAAGEGELEFSDIRVNSTPYERYKDITIETRPGDNEQTIIPGFDKTVSQSQLGYELSNSVWREVLVTGTATEAIQLSIECPNGLYHQNDDGGLGHVELFLSIQYKKKSDTDWKTYNDNLKIEGSTATAIRNQYIIEHLDPDEYYVRIKIVRYSESDPNNIRNMFKTNWTAVGGVVYDGFRYPGTALVAMKGLATEQLSGSPNVTFLKTRAKVWAYNPHTGNYEQQDATNPAWAAYDYIHQAYRVKNNHTGQFEFDIRGASADLMLYDRFAEWAKYCDKKNLKINIEMSQADNVLSAVNENIAPIGYGVVLLFGTKYGPVWDSISEPVQMFGMGNIIKGTFNEEFLPTNDRANAIEVTFTNKDKNYERDTVTVYGSDYDTDNDDKTTQVTCNGITDYKQAYRYGKFQLFCNERLIRTVSFEADVDAIACTVGDVVLISHDIPEWSWSGRIISKENGVYKFAAVADSLDANIPKWLLTYRASKSDKLYQVNCSVTKDDEYIYVKPLTTPEETPGVGDICAVSSVTTGVKPFTIKNITRSNSGNTLRRKITCLEYDTSVFNEDYTIPTINYSSLSTTMVEVSNLRAYKNKYKNNAEIVATWEVDEAVEAFLVYISHDNGSTWEKVADTPLTACNISCDKDTDYLLKVRTLKGGIISAGKVVNVAEGLDIVPPATLPKNITAYTRYRTLPNGSHRYDILVSWESKDLIGRVWYKTNHVQGEAIVIEDGLSADELGFAGAWVYAGQGKGQLIIPQALPGDTYRIAVTTADGRGVFNLPDTAPKIDKLVALKSTIPNTPDNFKMVIGSVAHLSWNPVTNADVQFYELRTNSNAGGDSDALLARTDGLSFDVTLTKRNGTLYLFACNTEGKYSAPATISYNKPAPLAPPKPDLISAIGGFSVVANPIPADCAGMAVYIDPAGASITRVTTQNSVYSYSCPENIYEVSVAYYDMFGEGARSPSNTVTVKLVIDESMLKDGAISLKKVDESIKKALEAGKVSRESVNQIVSNLNKKDGYKTYSALTQLNNAIELRVKDNEIINRINLTPKGTTIDGGYLHITGKTTIDNNVIVNGMIAANAVTSDKIAAGAVTANKISVNSLEAVSANVGNLTGGTISGTTLIGSTIRNASNTFSVDPDGNIVGATLKAGTIDGNSVRINGYNVRAVSILKGTGRGDFTIPLPEGYEEKDCVWTAFLMSNARSTYSFSMNGRRVHSCEISGDYPDPLCGYMVIGIK